MLHICVMLRALFHSCLLTFVFEFVDFLPMFLLIVLMSADFVSIIVVVIIQVYLESAQCYVNF